MYQLVRATCDNGAFGRLSKQWHAKHGVPRGVYAPMMAHATKIAAESPIDPRYGIFVLVNNYEEKREKFVGLAHINHMHPKTSRPALRMTWNLLSPDFVENDVNPKDVAELTASYIFGGIKIVQGEMKSASLKLYLQNITERRYAAGVAAALQTTRPDWGVAIHGEWLHIDHVPRGGGGR